MEKLKDMAILVGKEPGSGRLLVWARRGGLSGEAAVGGAGSVPACVSRCLPARGAAHCRIDIDGEGRMTLANLKPGNVTYVDGLEVASRRVVPGSVVELGAGRYALDLPAVLDAAGRIAAAFPAPPAEYSLAPLRKVWEEYDRRVKAVRKRQRAVGLWSGVPVALSMLGGFLTGVAGDGMRPYMLAFTGAALVVLVVGLYLRFTDKSAEEIEKLTEKFQDEYACPNPDCRHFMGHQPYNVLKQNKSCPYCRCKYAGNDAVL